MPAVGGGAKAAGGVEGEADVAVIVTGAAGFVGSHVARALLARGERVVGVDNLNAYYSPRLKQARLDLLLADSGFSFRRADIADRDAMFALVDEHRDTARVVHLAAQAGVSLYAATKRADELISHAYGHLYGLPQTGLRFFTVYGPWGRPDMAYYGFADAIMRGEPITVYDGGAVKRDFTYIDDIVSGVLACLDAVPGSGVMPRVFNIGNRRSEGVLALVALLEAALGRRAVVRTAPRPVADVGETCADLSAIEAAVGFTPRTPLEVGVPRFAAWFVEFHAEAFETPLTRRV